MIRSLTERGLMGKKPKMRPSPIMKPRMRAALKKIKPMIPKRQEARALETLTKNQVAKISVAPKSHPNFPKTCLSNE